MLLIDTGSTDPFFNIATEEFLFKNRQEDLLMLYINNPSIIIGKHQNPFEEINYQFITEKDLPVIRRMSGGGTVYHDMGNLNFTFMVNSETGKQVNFKKFIEPVVGFMADYGIVSEVGEKNEVRSGGLKYSGNAEHVFRNRVLHHGTILFSSELDNLRGALKRGDAIFESRSVKSNRTSVGNLIGQIREIDTTEDLKKAFLEYLIKLDPGSARKSLDIDEIVSINEIAESKYKGWDWNYAYGPDYKLTNTIEVSGRVCEVVLQVENGIIIECRISDGEFVHPLSTHLKGVRHTIEEINQIVRIEKVELVENEIYRLFG
jgi:lipoate-protein ligase A